MANHAPSVARPLARVPLVVVSALLLVAALCVDIYWLGVSPLAEHAPGYSAPYLIKACLVAAGSWLLVAAAAPRHRCRRDHADGMARHWRSWGIIEWRAHRLDSRRHSISAKRLIAWILPVGTLAFLLIALRAPGLVSRVAVEDGLVETLSAVFLLLASATFAVVAVRQFRDPGRRDGWLSVLLPAGMALVAFVIAMEEISWMQRLFDVETPAALSANDQGEMNFHNLATAEFENAYYFAGFLAFVLGPFLVDHGHLPDHRLVDDFAPSRFLVYPAATFVAFNFEMWNIVLTQITVFTTLFILLHYGLAKRRSGGKGTLQFVLVGVVVVTQAAFFALSPRFDPYWLATEYKEFLIPVVILLYAIEVALRTNQGTGRPSQPIAASSS